MKLRSSFTDREIKQWERDRNKACLSYDVNKFREFYNKWLLAGMYSKPLPQDVHVLEITMRKMVYHINAATPEQKAEAKQWLEERGCSTSL